MPRDNFPEFKGKSESEISQILHKTITDTSYHSDYNISYAVISDEFAEAEIASWNWNDIMRFMPGNAGHPARDYANNGDACWGDLPSSLHYFTKDKGYYPKWLLFRFRTDPFKHGAPMGDGNDDYYNDYDYDDDGYYDEPLFGDDLSHSDIVNYCDWLVKHEFILPFDVDWFYSYYDGGFGYFDLDLYNNLNKLYFACTMIRYTHEGQNIVRRILAFDRLFDLDPFVNVVLAHQFADFNYNGGHCVCAMHYWDSEKWGGDYWKNKNLQPSIYKKYPPLYYAKIATAMRLFWNTAKDDRDRFGTKNGSGYPYFAYEKSIGSCFNKLSQMKTPKTWRGLLRLDTRRLKCVNSPLVATQKCSLKKKAA